MAEIDWDYWTGRELWPLEVSCKLVYREDPSIQAPREVIWSPDHSRLPWVKLFHRAQEAMQARTLRSVTRRTFDGHTDVLPAEFLTWAQKGGVTIHPELIQMLCPATLQEAAWEGFDPDSDTYPCELDIALRAWRAATNLRDLSKTPKEQIREWLGAHYPAGLSEEAKRRIAMVCNWEKGGGRRRRK